MKAYKTIFLASLMIGGLASAEERAVQTLKSSQYDSMKASQLNPQTLFYTQKIKSFDAWTEQDADESQVLALFPGYEEPTVAYIKEGERKEIQEKLMMYVVRTKTVLQKPAAQIDVAGMIKLANIKKFDPAIQHVQINTAQLMPNVVGKKDISNFDWCNKGGDYIVRPKKEIDMSHLTGHQWCQSSDRSTCVESCYIFTPIWQKGVKTAATLMDARATLTGKEADRKDLGVGMQSEIRYYLNEAEYGAGVPLSKLTRINTPVRGIIEQNIFYFNQVFQFGKIVSVLQDKEGDANQTVMSNFIVMGVRERSWKKYPMLPDILQGQAIVNTATGLTAGIPVFTQDMSKSIAKLLEQ